jgi:hypothetical protein
MPTGEYSEEYTVEDIHVQCQRKYFNVWNECFPSLGYVFSLSLHSTPLLTDDYLEYVVVQRFFSGPSRRRQV